MRPHKIVIAVASSLTAVLLTIVSLRTSLSSSTGKIPSGTSSDADMLGFFSFRTPLSLFPPKALITLTQDNTTSFLARPAAFGPGLSSSGLRGQVWIGSGFGEFMPIGELGCSDVPGWSSSSSRLVSYSSKKNTVTEYNHGSILDDKSKTYGEPGDKSFEVPLPLASSSTIPPIPAADDFTDDYLHHPLPASKLVNSNYRYSSLPNEDHADIQSLQEAAEISGKVVLLSRGGCGFLEKVKWSQRRGAAALIVGDNTKSGPLIQMFARGDTSNITIPSVFTSYTTANLLCSLVASGTSMTDKFGRDLKSTAVKTDNSKNGNVKPNADSSSTSSNLIAKSITNLSQTKKCDTKLEMAPQAIESKKSGWLKSIFTSSINIDSKSEISRPPSSGQLNWEPVDNMKITSNPSKYIESTTRTKKQSRMLKKTNSEVITEDGFIIGVQDWRDPDLIVSNRGNDHESSKKTLSSFNAKEQKSISQNADLHPKLTHPGRTNPEITGSLSQSKRESITPSSGEYSIRDHDLISGKFSKKNTKDGHEDPSKGLLANLFNSHRENIGHINPVDFSSRGQSERHWLCDDEHEGLWVTLSSSSRVGPFLDTLLVLVFSPLVTITILYVLLLIRSRYRRQRWRAPKSVVDRLPVRTYQTIVSSNTNSPRVPNLSDLSATAPLLQSISKSYSLSQMTSGISESSKPVCKSSKVHDLIDEPQELNLEKQQSKSNGWKNQVGTHVECVVCLEEYIDGVSRIMGLPCGHEFHVDCITPWLTTRRRTCPICKGDVVRSLALSSRYEPFHDVHNDEENYIAMEHPSISSFALDNQIIPGTPNEPSLGNSETYHRLETTRTGSWRDLLAGNFGVRQWNIRSTNDDHIDERRA